MTSICLEFDIAKHKILFEDKKSSNQQIEFSGIPFIINGMQRLECVHGVDHFQSKKKKLRDEKFVNFLYVIQHVYHLVQIEFQSNNEYIIQKLHIYFYLSIFFIIFISQHKENIFEQRGYFFYGR